MHPLLRLFRIVGPAGLGLAVAGLALVPAADQFRQASNSGKGVIDLGPLDQRSYVYAADGSLLATLRADVDRQPVRLAAIPDHTIDAVLAVEDAGFYHHEGVNLRATLRALVANVDSGETVQGGSTITQQLVKQEIVGSKQTLDRKAREAILARRLEDTMTKDEILERYLNTVYVGNGAYGVQAGAETYFGISVSRLGLAESAFLAGMIANPSAFDPIRRPDASLARRNLALRRLEAYGTITADDVDRLERVQIPRDIRQVQPQPNTYFVEEVKQQLLDDVRLGATPEERYYAVFRGGLQIHTTLDPRAQRMATESRNDVLGELAPTGTEPGIVPLSTNPDTGEERVATGAVVSVEPNTGAIRAMVGGAGFEDNQFNVTTQGLRSGGSTFKIFVLMALLENGYVPNDSVSGSGPCSFTGVPGLRPDPYRVENFGNSGGGGGTILQQTLRSSNCAYVRLGQIVGTEKVAAQARKMGITTPMIPVVSMPLGTQEVFPLDMAAAVASIANDGVFNPPYYVERVDDRDGHALLKHEPNPRRAQTPASARLAADVLERNVQGGTGTRARIPGQHAAGKTGTAQNSGNGWFVGFTPYLSTAVWIGSTADNFEVRIRGTGITGGSYPAEIWGRYMRAWHEGLKSRDFKDPPKTRTGRYLQVDRRIDRSGGSRYFGPTTPTSGDTTGTTTESPSTSEGEEPPDGSSTTEAPPGTGGPPTTSPPGGPTTTAPGKKPESAAP
ncbi:MAG: transglycosylase domain-containing protein [Acidimicrobiales bacterium]